MNSSEKKYAKSGFINQITGHICIFINHFLQFLSQGPCVGAHCIGSLPVSHQPTMGEVLVAGMISQVIHITF